MEKEQKSCFIAFAILFLMIGFMIGTIFNEYIVNNCGIPTTSYCKKVQIDTIQYNYQKNMYKFEIKLIK